MKRIIVILVAILFGALILYNIFNPDVQNQKNAIVFGYQEISLYQHLFTAYVKGYFSDEDLNVEIKPFASANRLMEGLLSGDLDGVGLTNLQVAITVEVKDPDRFEMVNFLVWQEKSYPDYIIARKDAGINKMSDLEGKIIGLHPGSAVRGFSNAVFENFKLDLSKIKTIELQPDIMQSAIVAKRVDALYCMDPVATDLVESGTCLIILANPMRYIFQPPVPISGTALSKKFIRERPDEAKRLIRALDKAILYIRDVNHNDEIAEYISKYTPINKALALKMNPSEYWVNSEIDRPIVQNLADRFYQLKIVEENVDVNTIIVNENLFNE